MVVRIINGNNIGLRKFPLNELMTLCLQIHFCISCVHATAQANDLIGFYLRINTICAPYSSKWESDREIERETDSSAQMHILIYIRDFQLRVKNIEKNNKRASNHLLGEKSLLRLWNCVRTSSDGGNIVLKSYWYWPTNAFSSTNIGDSRSALALRYDLNARCVTICRHQYCFSTMFPIIRA